MKEYLIILDIVTEVLNGKNLTDCFNTKIAEIDNINISKIKDISYGTIRNYYQLNLISHKLVKNKHHLTKAITIIILIGFYELLHSKKPDFAVINDIVELAFISTKNIKARNLVNAIFRAYLTNADDIAQQLSKNLEYRYNFPTWLINKLKIDYPKQYKNILSSLNTKPVLGIRINRRKIDFNQYLTILEQNQITYNLLDNKLIVELTNIHKLPFFNEGYVSVQDISAQKLIDFLAITDDSYVLDACSAPGGKTCQILENYPVELVSLDIDAKRLVKVKQNLQRLDLTSSLICGDATNSDWWDKRQFDFIIADVPCSASGTIKHNPDIKLHRKLDDVRLFTKLQREIVVNLWHKLKAGGQMLYITCSIFREENHDNIIAIQQLLSDMVIIKELSLLPNAYRDGFYYCQLYKQQN